MLTKLSQKESMKAQHFHAFKGGEFGTDNNIFVAFTYDKERGYISVSGLEHDPDSGYAYFTFDDFVQGLDPENSEEVMTYLGNSTDKGYSEAWYATVADVLKSKAEDRLLWSLAEAFKPADTAAVKRETDSRFEDFLCERNDELSNAAHDLLRLLASPKGDAGPDWNMELIGELLDDAEAILEKHGLKPCYPFHEGDDTPCWRGSDCERTDCPFRS